MKINGKVIVDKYIEDSKFQTFETLESLNSNIGKVGTIAIYNETLYWRKSENSIVPLIDTTNITNIINTVIEESNFITEINNTLINNNEFVEQIINNTQIINNVLESDEFKTEVIQEIINKLNVEVVSLKGKTLFYGFLPDDIDNVIDTDITDSIIGNDQISCILPESVNIIGNLKPLKGSTHEYNIDYNEDTLILFKVVGGVINTAHNIKPIQVTWDTDYNSLCSITVILKCESNNNIIYDTKYFILEDENFKDIINNNSNSSEIILKYGITKQDALLATENLYFLFGNSMNLFDIIYDNSNLTTKSSTGWYYKNGEYYYVVDGVITNIDNQ